VLLEAEPFSEDMGGYFSLRKAHSRAKYSFFGDSLN